MITIVDPVTSGRELSASFVERGVVPLHLYLRGREQAFAADPHPCTLLVDTPGEALGDLAARGATAVIAGSAGGVDAADQISHALGLPHHDAATALARRSVVAGNRALRAAGVPAPRTFLVRDRRGVDAALGRARFPVLVTPCGGERVVRHDPDKARAVLAEGWAGLVQEYLEGPQYTVETVSAGGCHLLGALHADRVDLVGDRPVVRESVLVRRLEAVHGTVLEHVRRALGALGIRDGAARTVVRVAADGPGVVRVDPRLTAASLDPALHRPALGYTHADLVAERFADPRAFALRFTDPYRPDASLATVALQVPAAGLVAGRPGLVELATLPGFVRAEGLPAVGDPVGDGVRGGASGGASGGAGVAYLRHPDVTVLRRSLDRLHGLVDRGELYDVVPTPSRTSG